MGRLETLARPAESDLSEMTAKGRTGQLAPDSGWGASPTSVSGTVSAADELL